MQRERCVAFVFRKVPVRRETTNICGGIAVDLILLPLRKSPLSARQHAKGGTPTVSNTNRSMNPKSESQMKRRRSRTLASAVGDLIQQSESLSTTADGSYGSTTQGQSGDFCPVAMHRPPYMDVQTVKTNLTADQAAKLEGQSHCLLLVEPVVLPNLGHTGVDRETRPGDRPLFYPNGQKKCSMGATVRNALYQSSTLHTAGAASAAQEQQGPPSDWAGSSAYHSPPSENSGSCYTPGHHSSSNQHSDEGSASAAVPAGQGGRFPTDVWGTPPGEDEGSLHSTTNNRHRRGRKPAGSGGGSLARQAASDSADSGSIVDRRLARYTGRKGEGESWRRCSSHDSLLAGRKAEVIRAQQWEQQQQDQQELQSTATNNKSSSRDNTPTMEPPQQGKEPPPTTDAKPQQSPTPTTSTQCSFDHFVAAPAHKGGASSTVTSDWTTTGLSTTGRGASFDAAGRDSEWLAERRAADREAKEVLSALKNNSARLSFLVGGG